MRKIEVSEKTTLDWSSLCLSGVSAARQVLLAWVVLVLMRFFRVFGKKGKLYRWVGKEKAHEHLNGSICGVDAENWAAPS
jgi:hypothetical protein